MNVRQGHCAGHIILKTASRKKVGLERDRDREEISRPAYPAPILLHNALLPRSRVFRLPVLLTSVLCSIPFAGLLVA